MKWLARIFTWWHGQTLNTALHTLLFGKFVGKDEYGNRYYRTRKIDKALGFERRWRRGIGACLAISSCAVLPSAGRKASASRSCFTPLNGWPTQSPVNASSRPSRNATHDSGAV